MTSISAMPGTPNTRMMLAALCLVLTISGLSYQSTAALEKPFICELTPGHLEVCVWRPCKDDQGNVIRHPDGQIAQCAKSLDEVNDTDEEEAQLPDPQPSNTSATIQLGTIDEARFLVPNGIGGGGAIKTTDGTANFAITATRMTPMNYGDSEPLVLGQLRWTATSADGSTTTFTSVLIDEYGWIKDIDGGRWARGTLTVNGEGEYPFVLRTVDGGPPDAGQDTIELSVGNTIEGQDSTSFGYHAEGSLTSGDLQLLGFTVISPTTGE